MSFLANNNGPSVEEQLAAMDDSTTWLRIPPPTTTTTTTSGSNDDSNDNSNNNNNNNNAPTHHEPSALCKGLKELEDELRCSICNEFMRNPVSVMPCQHTFCSTCIRQHFGACLNPPAGSKRTKRPPCCAHCSQPVDTPGRDFNKCLIPNWAVGRHIEIFCAIRSDLKHAVLFNQQQEQQQQQDKYHQGNHANNKAAAEVSRENTLRRSSRHNGSNGSNGNSPPQPADNKDTTAAACAPPQQQQQQQQQPQQQRQHLQPKAKVAYASLKKTQLQQLCAKEGLSTTGNEKELKERHRDWITFYNAECRDAQHPRSLSALLTEFQQEEHARKMQLHRETHNKALQRQRDAFRAIADPTSQQAKDGIVDEALNQAMQNNWGSLIAKAKKRMEKKNNKKKTTPADNSSSDNCNGAFAAAAAAAQDTEQPSSSTAKAVVRFAAAAAARAFPDQDNVRKTEFDDSTIDWSEVPNPDNATTTLPAENLPPGNNMAAVYDLTLSSDASDNNSCLGDDGKPAASNNYSTKLASQPVTSASLPVSTSKPPAAASATHTQSTSTPGNQNTAVTSLSASVLTELSSSSSSSSSSEREDVSSTNNHASNKKRKAAPSSLGSTNKARATQQTLKTVSLSRNNSNDNNNNNNDNATTAFNKRPRRNAPSIIGPWSCPSCTYYNLKFTFSTARCEMCDFPRNGKLPATNTGTSTGDTSCDVTIA